MLAAELGFLAFTIVVHGSWLAAMIYAFDQGGVAEAGLVASFVLGLAALSAPFMAVRFGRFPPRLALAGGYLFQAMVFAAAAAAIASDLTSLAVYPLLLLFTICQSAIRPTLSSVLPHIVNDPTELAAANSLTSLIETVGLVLGPGLAGLVLFSTNSLAAPFIASAAALCVAATVAMTINASTDHPDDESETASVLAEVTGGLALLRRQPEPRLLVTLLASMLLVFGALDVALVAVAVEQLGRSEATVGVLGTAIGLGAVVGAGLSFLLVGRRFLTLPMAAGLLAVAMPILALAATESLVIVMGLFALTGLGRPVVEVAGRTLLQGLSADDTLAQIFGFLEGFSLLALAAGSGGFSLLVVATNLSIALAATGILLPAFIVSRYAKLRSIDRARPIVDPTLLALMKQVSIFAPLPPFQIEQMLLNMDSISADAGQTVFSEGDEGRLLYVVAAGSAVVELPDGEVETGQGGFFGEIALLRDQPRMATVRAGERGLEAYTLERDVFLSSISATHRSRNRTDREVERRLGESG